MTDKPDRPAKHRPMSAKCFRRLSAFEKGAAVYLMGARKDEPNVPESYAPTPRTRAAYEAGQQAAVMAILDSDDD